LFEWLPSAISEAQQRAVALQIRWNADFAEPASEAELSQCEGALSRELSPQHRAFLKTSNGATLSTTLPDTPGGTPWADFGVRIYSTYQIVEETRDILDQAETSAIDPVPLVAVCGYDKTGDRCLADYSRISDGEPVIIDAFHETPDAWRSAEPIAQSFELWLRRMFNEFTVKGGILWYWLPDADEDISGVIQGLPKLSAEQIQTMLQINERHNRLGKSPDL
jgi:hypothetical protein